MVKVVNKDVEILKQKAESAVAGDIETVARDLLDTLQAYSHSCVGMAANMIGVPKAIIAVDVTAQPGREFSVGRKSELTVMLNPKLLKASPRTYDTEEGCLSLEGTRQVKRHEWIEVSYRDMQWKKQRRRFSGFVAEIIQHEMNHLDGKII